MGGLGRGSAKLILFGEHAAVFGHPAVGLSLSGETTVRFHGGPSPEWDLAAVAGEDREILRRLLHLLEELLPELPRSGRCKVATQSTIPRDAGFGSSAALCAALARAALAHCHGRVDAAGQTETWMLAHGMEGLFHGTPSGIDTGLSLLGGLFSFTPHPPALPGYEPLPGIPLSLVVGAVPRAAEAGKLIAGIGERMRAGDPATGESLNALGNLAGEARELLRSGSANRLAELAAMADRAMARLRRLGLSSRELDIFLEAGKRAGALGGKLSGAGGGGAFFLIMADEKNAREAKSNLESVAMNRGIPLVGRLQIVTIGRTGLRSAAYLDKRGGSSIFP